MIKESEIVTKKYLSTVFKKELKTEIISEVRVMMHETLEGAMENMKAYYKFETERYIGALMQEYKDERKVDRDMMKTMMEKWDNHETRLQVLEV